MFHESSFHYAEEGASEIYCFECKFDRASSQFSRRLLFKGKIKPLPSYKYPFLFLYEISSLEGTLTVHDVRSNASQDYPFFVGDGNYFFPTTDALPSLEEYQSFQKKQSALFDTIIQDGLFCPLKGIFVGATEKQSPLLSMFRGTKVQFYSGRNCDMIHESYHPNEQILEILQERTYIMILSQTSLHLFRHLVDEDKICPLKSFSFPREYYNGLVQSVAVTVGCMWIQKGPELEIALLTDKEPQGISFEPEEDESALLETVLLLPHCGYTVVSKENAEGERVPVLIRRDFSPK